MLKGRLRCQNDRKTILYKITFNLKGERVIFHPLSSRFLKENQFSVWSCVGGFGVFCPKGALGCQEDDEKKIFQREANLTISRWNFVSLLFRICFLPPKLLSKSATRWRSSMPDPCKTVLLSTWTQVLKRCNNKIYIFMQSWYVQNSIDALINICQSSISDMTACFFSFMTWVKKV